MDKINKISNLQHKIDELRRLEISIEKIHHSIQKNKQENVYYNDNYYFNNVYIKQSEAYAVDLFTEQIKIHRNDFIIMLESTLNRYKSAYKDLEEEILQSIV